jgi:lipoprotein-anchoring transpeptidase ErfK/SrfK
MSRVLGLTFAVLSAFPVAAVQAQQHASKPGTAQEADILLPDPSTLPAAKYDPSLPVVVVVDKQAHLTHVLQLQRTANGAQLVDVLVMPNTVGKPSTPTPNGRGVFMEKRLDPVWTPPASIDPKRRRVAPYSKTKKNPLGVAFLSTSRGQIGLHGTNTPAQIGKSVSHGCVRHYNEDILKLYDMVSPGNAVYFTRNFQGTQVKPGDFKLPVLSK